MKFSETPNPISRRAFIEKAATISVIGLAAPSLTSAETEAKPTSPNSRIQIGLIGCGGMGRSNLNNCARHPDVVVTGACDVWKSRRDAVVAQHKDTCKPYHDYREMLQAKDIDAVIIATPPHWHALQTIDACEAGKDIYLQKPMTLHLAESFAVRNAVKKHNIISQVGTQIHASENYRRVVEIIRSGSLGKIGVVRTFNVGNDAPNGIGRSSEKNPPEGFDWNFWCGPAKLGQFNPLTIVNAHNHTSWMDYGGGYTPGMAPHILDLPVWALDPGFPINTSCSGGRFITDDDGDAYDHHEVTWQYPNFIMTWMLSLTNSYGFDFQGEPGMKRRLGVYFHGVNGTLFSNYKDHKIVAEGDRIRDFEPPPKSIPSSPGHEREWLDCIKSRQQPSCNVAYHVKLDVPIALSLLSLKLGRSIRFDSATEKIVGDPEASRLAVPAYRDPWKFPKHYLQT